VFDNRQLTNSRLYQSIVAAKYINPDGIGTYVISALHTCPGRSILNAFNE